MRFIWPAKHKELREKEISLTSLTIDHEIFISIYIHMRLAKFEIMAHVFYELSIGQEGRKKSRKARQVGDKKDN